MVSYKPVAVQAFPKFGEKIAQDMLYWWGYKIYIYGHCSQEPIKMFSRFKDAAYCATYRDDGNPLVAGSEEGSIRLFDISGRAPLEQFDGRTKTDSVILFFVCISLFGVLCMLLKT